VSQPKQSGIRYLQYARGRFAFRRRVPADAAWAFEQHREVVVPLPCVNEVELARLVEQHNAAFERTLRLARARGAEEAERRVREDDIAVVAAAYERQLLATDDECRNGALSDAEFDEWGDFLSETLARRRRARARGQFDEIRDGMLEFLQGARLAPSSDETVMARLLRAVFDADQRAVQAELARHNGEIVPTPELPAAPGLYTGVGVMGEHGYLDSMYEGWRRRCRPGVKSLYEAELWLRRLSAFTGADPTPFASTLSGPPDVEPDAVGRRVHLRELPRSKVVEFKAHWLDEQRRDPKTVRKGLSLLAAIVAHALHEHPSDDAQLQSNTFHALWHKAERERGGTVRPRTAFEVEHLNAIFSSRLFMSAAPADGTMEAAMYWCTSLCAFTGARLDELGHLHTDDVTLSDGTWWMRIEAKSDAERVKNASSQRLVPLHDVLLRMGFPQYVERMRASGATRLFPSLKTDKKGGVTAALSKRLNRYLDEVGVKSERHCFYSLRHAFKHHARMSGIAKEVSDALCGHARGADASSNYGADSYPLEPLKAAIARFSIPGLRIEHLYKHAAAATESGHGAVQERKTISIGFGERNECRGSGVTGRSYG